MRTVKASQSAPPAAAADGESYRIKAPASGAWTGREDRGAVRIAGDWHFIEPVQGTALFDQAAEAVMVFRSGWKVALAPPLPSGGTIVDAEARTAISALIAALKALGILTG